MRVLHDGGHAVEDARGDVLPIVLVALADMHVAPHGAHGVAGATAKTVREMLPKAHFATVYAKPAGRPLVDTFITEVSQDTWIYLPWDMGLQFAPPIGEKAKA